jgi:hypothetical protein
MRLETIMDLLELGSTVESEVLILGSYYKNYEREEEACMIQTIITSLTTTISLI